MNRNHIFRFPNGTAIPKTTCSNEQRQIMQALDEIKLFMFAKLNDDNRSNLNTERICTQDALTLDMFEDILQQKVKPRLLKSVEDYAAFLNSNIRYCIS
jgi:hypothetical protein